MGTAGCVTTVVSETHVSAVCSKWGTAGCVTTVVSETHVSAVCSKWVQRDVSLL